MNEVSSPACIGPSHRVEETALEAFVEERVGIGVDLVTSRFSGALGASLRSDASSVFLIKVH
jgi:hypothetical protein